MTFSRNIVATIFTAVVYCGVVYAQEHRPLSVEDIEDLLKNITEQKRVVTLIEKHGVAFEVTEEVRERLKKSGAVAAVVEAVERVGLQHVRKNLWRELFPIPIDGKWGYINSSGRIVIPPQFDEAYDFEKSGFAYVKKSKGAGLVDPTGRLVVPPIYVQVNYVEEIDRIIAFTMMSSPVYKFKILDNNGNPVVDKVFESDSLACFSHGLAPVKSLGVWGYIDRYGRWRIDPKFFGAGCFDDETGLAPAAVGGKWGYIDISGTWKIKPSFEYACHFSKGLASVQIGGKFGYINPNGEVVITAKFPYCDDFSGGLISFKDERTQKSGFIDGNGRIAIPPKFDDVNAFFSNRSFAQASIDGRWGLIDRTGNWVLKPVFDRMPFFGEAGLSPMRDARGGKWGFINLKGEWAIQPIFASARGFNDRGLALVSIKEDQGTKWGYIDTWGKWIIGPR